MKRLFLIFLLLTGFVLAQTVGDAVRLSVPGFGSGARAMGMGNAFVAMSDDGLGMAYNPAGIALMRRFELGGGFKYGVNSNNTTFLGNQFNSESSRADLDNFTLVFPIPTLRGSLVVGTSYTSHLDFTGKFDFKGFNGGNSSMIQDLNSYSDIPYELYLTDDKYVTKINGKLDQSGSRTQTGSAGVWNFSGAYEAYKNFFLGATIAVGGGSYQNNFTIQENDVNGTYSGSELAPGYPFTTTFKKFDYKTVLDWDIRYYEIKIGMLYQVQNIARVGMTVELPKSYTIKEKYQVEASSTWGTGRVVELDPANYRSDVEYEIKTPFKFTGGVAFNVRGLIISAQGTFVDYTNSSFKDISGLGNVFTSDLNREISNTLRSVLNYNLGAEYTFPFIDMRLRAGYFIQKSPYKDDPAEYDRKFMTFGLGYLIDGELSFDVAYMFGWWKDFGDNYGFNQSRTFQDIKYNSAVFGVSFRF